MTDVIKARLFSVYEEIMWLARRNDVTASMARAWYTHIVSNRLAKTVRTFTGEVSEQAARHYGGTRLTLEHFGRIQHRLTNLVNDHIKNGEKPEEFASLIREYEKVRITTVAENYAAMRAKGDYTTAGITLLQWSELDESCRSWLRKNVLRGRVANAQDYLATQGRSVSDSLKKIV
jgi:hypothetical protein